MTIYKRLFSSLPEPSLLTDCSGMILDINRTLADLMGCDQADLVGNSIQVVFGEDFSPEECSQPMLTEADQMTVGIATLLRSDGSTLACNYSGVAVYSKDGEGEGIIYRLHLPGSVNHLPTGRIAVRRESGALHEPLQVNPKSTTDLAYLFELAGLDGAAYWSFSSLEGVFQEAVVWGFQGNSGFPVAVELVPVAHRVMESLQVEFLDCEGEITFPASSGLESCAGAACLPLIVRGRARGVLWMVQPSPFLQSQQRILGVFADMFSNLLNLELAEKEADVRSERLAALRKMDVAIKESYDLKVALGVVLDQAVHQLGVEAAAVLLLKPDGLELELIAQRGLRASLQNQTRFRMGQLPPGRVASDRVRLHIPVVREGSSLTEWEKIMAAEGFVGYYGMPLIARGTVKGVLQVFSSSPLYPDPDWEEFLEASAGQAAIAADKAELFNSWQRSLASLDISYDSTLQGWIRALQLRDRYTSVPDQRTIDKTLELAMILGLPDQNLVHLRRGVILHDVGKIGVPDDILFKPGPLDEREWGIMQRHPVFAYEMLSPISYLKEAVDIPYAHHERWDGRGYPRGLKGMEIPLPARIFTVVDVWAAMTSPRPYRNALAIPEVREYIEDNAGHHFDPRVVDVFLGLI